jgi:hypothetical protein
MQHKQTSAQAEAYFLARAAWRQAVEPRTVADAVPTAHTTASSTHMARQSDTLSGLDPICGKKHAAMHQPVNRLQPASGLTAGSSTAL